MADVITRLKVESSEYDSKLRRAASSLSQMGAEASKAGNKIASANKDNVALARSLGNMQTVATSAKGKMAELTNAFTEASVVYKRLSDEEKQAPFGKALSQSLDQLKGRIKSTKSELEDIGKSLNGKKGGMLSGFFGDLGGGLAGGMSGLVGFAGVAGAATAAVTGLSKAVSNNIETAANFEYAISHLSSLTGMAGKDLDTLKQYAIDLGGSTTQSASQVAEAFMLIGSQKPELLKSSEALRDVTASAITLAEAANIDVTEAAKALTASLNIMGEGASESNRYINVLAAGSKEGAVDIQGLTDIVYKAGQAASLNKMSFEELIAVAETVGPSFGSAAEAGTALNAMLLKLETQSNDKFKPSVVGLQEALTNLRDAHLSAGDATKLVTETGYKALVPLLQNVEGVEKLNTAITGTNTAEAQANTNTDNLKGSLANLSSAWEKFNLTLNDSNGTLKKGVDKLVDLVNWTTELISKTDAATKARKELNKVLSGEDGGKTPTRGQQIGAINSNKAAAAADLLAAKSRTASARTLAANNPDNLVAARKLQDAIKAENDARAKYKVWQRAALDFGKTKATTDTTTVVTSGTSSSGSSSGTSSSKVAKVFTEDATTISQMADNVSVLQEQLKNLDTTSETYTSTLEKLKVAQRTYNSELQRQKDLLSFGKTVKGIDVLSGSDYDLSSGDTSFSDSLSGMKEIKMPKIDLSQFKKSIDEVKKGTTAFGFLGKNGTLAATAVDSLGQAFQNMEDPGAKTAGIIASAVATLALQFAEIPKGAEVWSWIAGSAAGVATLVSVISQIKSINSGSYASGGYVPGSSYSGDQLTARVNSGEYIMTRQGQDIVSQALASRSNSQAAQQPTGGNVVNGEDIILVANNVGKRKGWGELVFSRRM